MPAEELVEVEAGGLRLRLFDRRCGNPVATLESDPSLDLADLVLVTTRICPRRTRAALVVLELGVFLDLIALALVECGTHVAGWEGIPDAEDMGFRS
jgi:hypothetical protein